MSEPATEWPVAQPVAPLEQRLQQLETAIASLNNTKALEERMVERIAQQLQATISAEAERLAAVQRETAPVATPVAPGLQRMPGGSGWRLPKPDFSFLTTLPGLIADVFREAIAIFWMFIDVNYKVAWSTRMLALILLAAILTSPWWDPLAQLPFVGERLLDKLVILFLAFVMYKALGREARRYMESRDVKAETPG